MGNTKPVTISGQQFSSQSEAQVYLKEQKKELLPEGLITEGQLYEALKDVYEQYCNNSPGYELNDRHVNVSVIH